MLQARTPVSAAGVTYLPLRLLLHQLAHHRAFGQLQFLDQLTPL
jgi:hypothetical protein